MSYLVGGSSEQARLTSAPDWRIPIHFDGGGSSPDLDHGQVSNLALPTSDHQAAATWTLPWVHESPVASSQQVSRAFSHLHETWGNPAYEQRHSPTQMTFRPPNAAAAESTWGSSRSSRSSLPQIRKDDEVPFGYGLQGYTRTNSLPIMGSDYSGISGPVPQAGIGNPVSSNIRSMSDPSSYGWGPSSGNLDPRVLFYLHNSLSTTQGASSLPPGTQAHQHDNPAPQPTYTYNTGPADAHVPGVHARDAKELRALHGDGSQASTSPNASNAYYGFQPGSSHPQPRVGGSITGRSLQVHPSGGDTVPHVPAPDHLHRPPGPEASGVKSVQIHEGTAGKGLKRGRGTDVEDGPSDGPSTKRQRSQKKAATQDPDAERKHQARLRARRERRPTQAIAYPDEAPLSNDNTALGRIVCMEDVRCKWPLPNGSGQCPHVYRFKENKPITQKVIDQHMTVAHNMGICVLDAGSNAGKKLSSHQLKAMGEVQCMVPSCTSNVGRCALAKHMAEFHYQFGLRFQCRIPGCDFKPQVREKARFDHEKETHPDEWKTLPKPARLPSTRRKKDEL